jgi:hypothetical protein
MATSFITYAAAPSLALPPAAALNGSEAFPADQTVGGVVTTVHATIAQMATYFASGGGFIGSIIGTAHEIAVSTAAGVATLSFPTNGLTYSPAAGSTGLVINAAASSFGFEVVSNNAAGTSFGLYVQAGTNNTDYNSYFVNAAGTIVYAQLVGDGGLVLGNLSAAHSNGNGSIVLQPTSAVPGVYVQGAASGQASFQSALSSGGAFYNATTLNAALIMNSGGANYGTIGNTGTQTWGLGSSNTIGTMSSSGSVALQWNNGGSGANTVAIGNGTFTSTGSAYQAASRALLMMNGPTSGDTLIDFSVNGTTGGFIQYSPGSFVRHYTNSLPIEFWPGTVRVGAVAAAGEEVASSLAGFVTISNATYQRAATNGGYLDGNYANVETGATPGCIYTIGGLSYLPTTTTLGTMYGIGYTLGNVSGIVAMGQAANWGMYIANNGSGTLWFDANAGTMWAKGAAVLNNGGGNGLYFSGSGINLGGAGGKVTAQSGGTASGGNAGDIILIY